MKTRGDPAESENDQGSNGGGACPQSRFTTTFPSFSDLEIGDARRIQFGPTFSFHMLHLTAFLYQTGKRTPVMLSKRALQPAFSSTGLPFDRGARAGKAPRRTPRPLQQRGRARLLSLGRLRPVGPGGATGLGGERRLFGRVRGGGDGARQSSVGPRQARRPPIPPSVNAGLKVSQFHAARSSPDCTDPGRGNGARGRPPCAPESKAEIRRAKKPPRGKVVLKHRPQPIRAVKGGFRRRGMCARARRASNQDRHADDIEADEEGRKPRR